MPQHLGDSTGGRPHRERWCGRWLWVAAPLALLVIGGGTALAATGTVPEHGSGTSEQQEELGRGLTILQRYVHTHPGGGYANVAVDEQTDTMSLAWHGTVPDELRSNLAATDLTIRFHDAPFAAGQLDAALTELVSPSTDAALAAVGVRRVAASPSVDGEGLVLDYMVTDGRSTVDEEAIRRAVDRLSPVPVVRLNRSPDAGGLQ